MRRRLFLPILLGTFFNISYNFGHSQVIRTVALTGQQAPGLPDGNRIWFPSTGRHFC